MVSPYGIFSTRRKNQHNHHHSNNNHRLIPIRYTNISLKEFDEENSSCGGVGGGGVIGSESDEIYFVSSQLQQHRRQNNSYLPQQNVIPRQNFRLRSLIDRLFQEIEKIRSKLYKKKNNRYFFMFILIE